MSASTTNSHEPTAERVTHKPRTIPDLSRRFRAWAPGGPRTNCKYCEVTIAAKPKRGINERRRAHLDMCEGYQTYMARINGFEQVHGYNSTMVLDSMRGSEDNNVEEEEEEEDCVKEDEVKDIDQEIDEKEDEVAHTLHITHVFEQYLREDNFPKPDKIDLPDEDTDIFSDMMINILLAYVFLKFAFYQS
jgi:hypothetical protein